MTTGNTKSARDIARKQLELLRDTIPQLQETFRPGIEPGSEAALRDFFIEAPSQDLVGLAKSAVSLQKAQNRINKLGRKKRLTLSDRIDLADARAMQGGNLTAFGVPFMTVGLATANPAIVGIGLTIFAISQIVTIGAVIDRELLEDRLRRQRGIK